MASGRLAGIMNARILNRDDNEKGLNGPVATIPYLV